MNECHITWSYLIELVEVIPLLFFDLLLDFVTWQVNSEVQISEPEHVTISEKINTSANNIEVDVLGWIGRHALIKLIANCAVILDAVLHLMLTSRQMSTDEAHGAIVVTQFDGQCTLVASQTADTDLRALDLQALDALRLIFWHEDQHANADHLFLTQQNDFALSLQVELMQNRFLPQLGIGRVSVENLIRVQLDDLLEPEHEDVNRVYVHLLWKIELVIWHVP